MPQETEIKLPVRDVKSLFRVLSRLGVPTTGRKTGRLHEWNVVYDTPEGGLAKHGQLLRIRTETPEIGKGRKAKGKPRTVLTFKQPAIRAEKAAGNSATFVHSSRHKVREEIEMEVGDASALGGIFEGLGMRGWFRYEKYRTTWRFPATAKWANGLLIELDETPIGSFLELEGPPAAIDRAAELLGYHRSDYILKSYLALYLDECRKRGESPRDMVFENQ